MAKKLLSDDSKKLIGYLMSNEKIASKVKLAGGEGERYVIYSVKDSGIVVLGKTKYTFWNRLIKCQFPLTFQAFVSAVWDGLLDLSAGTNKEALLKGLSKEIMEKAQREKEYDWVIERLIDCYRHVCNNKGAGAAPEGAREKSGPSVGSRVIVQDNNPTDVNVNLNINGHKRNLRFPDATGQAFLDVEFGVTGVHVATK